MTVIDGIDWQLQMDNQLPVTLKIGGIYRIPAEVYHRIIRGNGDLYVIITEV